MRGATLLVVLGVVGVGCGDDAPSDCGRGPWSNTLSDGMACPSVEELPRECPTWCNHVDATDCSCSTNVGANQLANVTCSVPALCPV